MKELARSYVWWQQTDQDIEKIARECTSCQLQQKQPITAPLHSWEWPARPWRRVHVDFAGPFLGSMFLLLVDAHSNWPKTIPMNSTTATKTVSCSRTIFAQYVLPEQFAFDNDPQFISDELRDFLPANGVQHIRSSPYHPFCPQPHVIQQTFLGDVNLVDLYTAWDSFSPTQNKINLARSLTNRIFRICSQSVD